MSWHPISRATPTRIRITLYRRHDLPLVIGQWVENYREGEGAWADDHMQEIVPTPTMWARIQEGPG